MPDGRDSCGPGGAKYISDEDRKRLSQRRKSSTAAKTGTNGSGPRDSEHKRDSRKGAKQRGKGMGRESTRAEPIKHYHDHMAEHGDMRSKKKKAKPPGGSTKKLARNGSAKPAPTAADSFRVPYKADARMAERVYTFHVRTNFLSCAKPTSTMVRVDEGLPALALFLLNLTECQVHRHWNAFKRASGGDGSISHADFFDLLDLDPTPFLKSLLDAIVFDWADLNHDHNLTFSEFLLASTVVNTLTARELVFFVFSLFDANGDGELDYAELKAISEAVSGASSTFGGNSANFLAICDSLDAKKDLAHGTISFDDFLMVTHRCPLVCHPAHHLQGLFRAKTLSPSEWDGVAAKFAKSNDANQGEFHTQMREAGLKILEENHVDHSSVLG